MTLGQETKNETIFKKLLFKEYKMFLKSGKRESKYKNNRSIKNRLREKLALAESQIKTMSLEFSFKVFNSFCS